MNSGHSPIPKADGKSKDIVEDNIEKLKELFPEVFSEGKIKFDQLQEILGEYIVNDENHYNFTWHGKRQAGRLAQTPSTATLRPCKEESVDWDTTKNLFIEGDNLEVLKLLQKSYHRKVKMIYIDPPYNTGNDFIYPDDFKDGVKNYLELTGQVDSDGKKLGTNASTAGRYHTNWLNMMYPRLKLARNLLRDDGVIFISIDENEVANLKMICDEIYGGDNFIECITWNKRIPKNDKGFGNIHEYILLYVKDSSLKLEFTMRKDGLSDIYTLLDKLKRKNIDLCFAESEIKKLYKKNGYDRGITLYNSLDSQYKLWGKINMSWPNSNSFGPKYQVIHPKTKMPVKTPDRGWRWKEETFNEAASYINGEYTNVNELHDGSLICGRIWFSKDEKTQPSSVTYLDDVNTFLLRSILSKKSDGGVEVEKLFEGKNFFSYPKPTSLLKILFSSLRSKQGDIFLDFFSGSATTAQSILDLNYEDKLDRKFICVQLPEPCDEKSEAFQSGYKTIADIGKERIRRAGKKIKQENPEYDGDLGFKVFKLDTSNIKRWESTFDNLEQQMEILVDHIKKDRSSEDILYELLLKYGLDLTVPIQNLTLSGKTIYSIGQGALIVCLEPGISLDVINEIGKIKEELQPEVMRVVFKDDSFADDVVKTNALQTLKRFGIDDVKSL